MDLILLTESRYEQPTNPNWYVQNILTEDRLVQEALERRGLRVARLDWATPDFDWSTTRYALFRTTWDYFHRFREFCDWLERAAQQTRLLNPASLIHWNLDKHYLQDLEQRGIRITPSHFIEAGEGVSLREAHERTGWRETVLKPAVSGAGRHTYKLAPTSVPEYEHLFGELLQQEAMMLQPFQHNVVDRGELSLMVIDGQVTHAVLKIAKPGDFRVQDDFGGTVHLHEPTPAETAFAEKVIAACSPRPIYARVDLIYDNKDQLALTELELVEPEMWFRMMPEAAERLAEAVVGIVNGARPHPSAG